MRTLYWIALVILVLFTGAYFYLYLQEARCWHTYLHELYTPGSPVYQQKLASLDQATWNGAFVSFAFSCFYVVLYIITLLKIRLPLVRVVSVIALTTAIVAAGTIAVQQLYLEAMMLRNSVLAVALFIAYTGGFSIYILVQLRRNPGFDKPTYIKNEDTVDDVN